MWFIHGTRNSDDHVMASHTLFGWGYLIGWVKIGPVNDWVGGNYHPVLNKRKSLDKPIVLLSGGIGVTPMLSMLNTIAKQTRNETGKLTSGSNAS